MTVGHEIDRTINKKSEELGKILIAMKQFHQHQKKKELCCIRQQESTGKKVM